MALIHKFKETMQFGGARNNQFKVTLAIPGHVIVGGSTGAQLQAIGSGALGRAADTETAMLEKASFHCRATNLPGQTLAEIPVSFRGRTIYLAGDRTFDDAWTTTFFNDADFAVRTMVERWMNAINDLTESTGLVNPLSYQTDLHVQHLDRVNNVLKNYKFEGAWPTSISQIDLAAEQADAVETFDVTWRYMHFTTSGVGANPVAVNDPDASSFSGGVKDNPNALCV